MKLRSPGVEEDIGSMKGYGQFCPIAKASEVLAERWTFLIVRELLFGSRRYNDIRRGVPRMSPALLAARLKQLEGVGVIERVSGAGRGVEYQLTEAGHELKPLVMQLADWGHRWTYTKFRREDLDPGFLGGQYAATWSWRSFLRTSEPLFTWSSTIACLFVAGGWSSRAEKRISA